jgi:tellurite resistance protein TehA-like permease
MVMATGIVSVASQLLAYRAVAVAMFALNAIIYLALWVLTVVRIAKYRPRVVADLHHHGRAVGFFTIVAATCVLARSAW